MDKRRFEEALLTHQQGELQRAEQLYLEILNEEPDQADVLHLLAILNAQQKRYKEALPFAERAIAVDPKSPSYHNTLGNIHKHLGELDEAAKEYTQALKLDPNYAVAHNSIGNIYYQQGDFDAAIKHYLEALRLKPDYADAQFNVGIALAKQEKIDKAIDAFRKTLSLQPDHPEAHAHLAKLLQRQDQHKEAICQFREGLKDDPKNPELHHGLGASLMKRGEIPLAIAHLKRTLRLAPKHPEAYHNLGAAYIAQGNPLAALKYYLRLIQIAPDVDAYYNLGVIYMYQDKHRDAITYFDEALRMDPEHLSSQINLANTYLKMGDFDHAAEHYRVAQRLDPSNQEIDYLLAAITEDKEAPKAAPDDYVKHLFDQYAPYFDEHLTKALKYQAPELLYKAVTEELGTTQASWTILDLGCGTGLSGEPFRHMAKKLIGIDLSEKMIETAQEKGIYDELKVMSIDEALSLYRDCDLIISVDTVVYLGDLEPLFAGVTKALKAGGIFAFTVEKGAEYPYHLQHSARYAHAKRYIEELIEAHHFTLERCDSIISRQQKQRPVEGSLFVLRT